MPVCYALLDAEIWSPLDEKPKRAADMTALRRVQNLLADDRATLLVDRWNEDWSALAFVELAVRGCVVGPEDPRHASVVTALRARYPQYAGHRLETRPLLRFTIEGTRAWLAVRREPPGA